METYYFCRYMYGTIKEPETTTSGLTPVHVFYTRAPSSILIPAGTQLSGNYVVLMAASPFRQEALDAYLKGTLKHGNINVAYLSGVVTHIQNTHLSVRMCVRIIHKHIVRSCRVSCVKQKHKQTHVHNAVGNITL